MNHFKLLPTQRGVNLEKKRALTIILTFGLIRLTNKCHCFVTLSDPCLDINSCRAYLKETLKPFNSEGI